MLQADSPHSSQGVWQRSQIGVEHAGQWQRHPEQRVLPQLVQDATQELQTFPPQRSHPYPSLSLTTSSQSTHAVPNQLSSAW
jgi:hypothetical protein